MKKTTFVTFLSISFGLIASIAISAAHFMQNPGDNPVPQGEYLPALIDGYVRLVSADGSVYIIPESDFLLTDTGDSHETHPNTNHVLCAEVLPSAMSDYFRVLPEEGSVFVIHESALEVFCSANNPQSVPPHDFIPCDEISAYIPTNHQSYYRILLDDSSLHIVHESDLSRFCDVTI